MLTMGRPLKMGGNAWQYLTDSVAGAAELGADAAGYYAAKGTPPGRFLGRGLEGLGPGLGSVKPGDVVSPEMLHRMLAQLADPVTGQPVGRLPDGAARPGGRLRPHISSAKIRVAHVGHGGPSRTGGIEEVMAEALGEVVSWAEDHVFFTRTGAHGARQESVRGVVASTWLHYESRDGDAQLHHHCVVWNRAQTVSDGVWRTLDGRGPTPLRGGPV